MPGSKLHIYSARFEPRPLVGVRFANSGIVEEFQGEMDARWEALQNYLDMWAQTTTYVHNSFAAGEVITWQHAECGRISPVKSGLILPSRTYALVGCSDAAFVTVREGSGIDYGMEMLFSVADCDTVISDVRRMIEEGLPSNIVRREVRSLYAENTGEKIKTGVMGNPTKTSGFRQN